MLTTRTGCHMSSYDMLHILTSSLKLLIKYKPWEQSKNCSSISDQHVPLLFSEWPWQFHLLTLNLRACLPPMPCCTITSLPTKVCSQKTWRQNSNLFLIILASAMYNLTMTTHSFGMILMMYHSCSHFHAFGLDLMDNMPNFHPMVIWLISWW